MKIIQVIYLFDSCFRFSERASGLRREGEDIAGWLVAEFLLADFLFRSVDIGFVADGEI
jgi:hypothetical protein